MAERLAAWVWVGAGALAGVAGIVNVVGFLGFQHQAITHLTGNTSLLGAALVAGNARDSLHLAGAIAAFVAGAMLSGLLIQDSVLRLGRRYGVVLTIESALLLAAVPLFRHQQWSCERHGCAYQWRVQYLQPGAAFSQCERAFERRDPSRGHGDGI